MRDERKKEHEGEIESLRSKKRRRVREIRVQSRLNGGCKSMCNIGVLLEVGYGNFPSCRGIKVHLMIGRLPPILNPYLTDQCRLNTASVLSQTSDGIEPVA
jgi:hypothetical protein